MTAWRLCAAACISQLLCRSRRSVAVAKASELAVAECTTKALRNAASGIGESARHIEEDVQELQRRDLVDGGVPYFGRNVLFERIGVAMGDSQTHLAPLARWVRESKDPTRRCSAHAQDQSTAVVVITLARLLNRDGRQVMNNAVNSTA